MLKLVLELDDNFFTTFGYDLLLFIYSNFLIQQFDGPLILTDLFT